MRRRLALALAAMAALGCESTPRAGGGPAVQAEAPPAPAPLKGFTPPPEFKRLRISLTPHLDPDRLKEGHVPLAGYLSKALGVPVEVDVSESYDALGAQLRGGEVDLAEFSPFAYVRALRSGTQVVPLANVIADGSVTAAGYIVVRADSPYRRVHDLKGKRFAFVDPASTSGFLFPSKVLLDHGVDPKRDFSQTAFLGNHEAVALAVFEKEFEGGALYQGALTALQRSHGVDPLSFRIIAKTPRTPRAIFCARPGLPPPVIERLREVLMALSVRNEEGRAILRPLRMNGFVPPDESLYQRVREVDALFDGGASE